MVKKPTFVLFGILLLVALAACRLPQPPGYGTNDPGVSADPTPAALQNPEADDGNPTNPAPRSTSGTEQSEPREGEADVPELTDTFRQGEWNISVYEGATDQMLGWADNLEDLVADWEKFPNEDYAPYNFQAKDGVEYGMAESAYCQQDQSCDVNVAAGHYRLITGDYNIPGIDSCVATEEVGCAILLVNVGEVTAMFRDSSVDYGFTVSGRYWNGDAMPVTLRALGSNTAYNMTNSDGLLWTNEGSNCSVRAGCKRIRFAFEIISGNQLLMEGNQVVVQ